MFWQRKNLSASKLYSFLGFLPQKRDADSEICVESSAKMYSEMMKASAAVTMTGGADITPSKKRGRKNDDDGATTPTEKKKRVRKPKNTARVAAPSPNEDDEEESPNKKVKIEAKDEDEEEDGMNGMNEGQDDDVAA